MSTSRDRNTAAMKECEVFTCILTPNAIKDIEVLYQISMAIKLEKPMYAIIQKGTKIPWAIEKLNWKKKYYFSNDQQLEAICLSMANDAGMKSLK